MLRNLRRAATSGAKLATRFLLPFAAAVLAAASAGAADPVFDNMGFSANRELVSQLPFEHVDPMTGNLLLTFTDLELPGNAGFNLRIQRTYNSKIYKTYETGEIKIDDDSWAGIGWRLHFGRVHLHQAETPGPVIEMPDGSRHQSYPHRDPSLAGHFITREYWTYLKVSPTRGVLRLPSGLTYVFASDRGSYLSVTEIFDPFGNKIVVNYAPPPPIAPEDAIESVEQRLTSGEVRIVRFTYDELLPYPHAVEPRLARSLATMTYQPVGQMPRVWTYSQRLVEPHDQMTHLVAVTPPLGPSWKFEYQPGGVNPAPRILAALTTPSGGRIEYSFASETFRYGALEVKSPVLGSRAVSGPGLTAGTWHYEFNSPHWTLPVTAIITGQCGKERYVTNAIGPASDERPWAIGTPARKETINLDGTVLQIEELDWKRSVPISNFAESLEEPFQTHVPLLLERRVIRGGQTYRTAFTYDESNYNPARASNFNDYGRAREVLETGESGTTSRKTTRTFFYGSSSDPSFGTYIVDKTASETVREPAGSSQSFTNTYEYETSGGYRGFMKAQTIRGIRTEFTQELDIVVGKPTGNVKTITDGNGKVTSFAHAWGQTREIKTPAYTISRVINIDGTLASETRRGFKTSFLYDALMRETKRTPPVGNPTLTTHDNAHGREVTVSRGPGGGLTSGGSRVTTTLDGFGRVIGVANNLSDPVKSVTTYDACGRTTFESYPFTGSASLARGASFTYDALSRLVERKEPSDTSGEDEIRYAYGPGLKVTVTDENGNETEQNWQAFGDPGAPRLASLKDAEDETTFYSYNALGSLLSVTRPSEPGRTWTYYSAEAGGRPGLLKSEAHPESGTVTYTYDGIGNLKSRTDARGTTTHTYDGNNRLVQVVRPDSYVLNLAYDASDNRTLMEALMPGGVSAKSTFTYDSANRQTQRKDELKIRPPKVQSFTTIFAWDGNDRLDTITYPSSSAAAPRKVKYTYDVAGRILSVANPGKRTYSDLFTYHPTGAVKSYRTVSGQVQSFDYTRRNRLKRIKTAPLDLEYAYEANGNVHSIDDSRAGFDQTFGYDALDRLVSSSSPTSAFAGTFAYDSRGNRLSSTLGGPATFSYHGPSDRLQTVNRAGVVESLSYDGYGNLVGRQVGSEPPEAFTYTPDHMLETATVGGLLTRYRYDGDGSRVAKEEAGGGLRFYIHGPGGQLLSELRECATSIEPVRDSIQAGGRLIAFVKPSLPAVALMAASAGTAEQPAGVITLTLRITTVSGCPTAEAATVAFSTANGTAIAGSDYVATAGTLTFPSGTASGTTQTVTIPLVNDTLIEPTEAFSFKLSAPERAVLGTPNATSITIADNDLPSIGWVLPATSVSESAGSVTLSLRVTTAEGNPLPAAASVRYATANGTAAAPKDYIAQSGTLEFAAGLPSGSERTITVPVVKDALVEKDEMFKLVLSLPMGATVGISASATVTILDVSPQLAFSSATVEGVEGAQALLSVQLVLPDGQPTLIPVAVKCATANISAKAGLDFTTTNATLSFPAGSATGSVQTVAVPLREDAISEDNETFKVTLSAPKGGRLGTLTVATVTILDNDPSPLVSISDASLIEPNSGSKGMSFAVRLSAPAGREVSVRFATTPMSAQAASDFTASTGRMSFAAGTTSRTIAIPIRGDTLDEENEAFLVSLSDPVSAGLGRAVAQGTILDNDGQPALCQVIAVVPYKITTSGHYCLAGDISFSDPAGAAIAIEADFVRLDLQGYRLDGSAAGRETQAVGVQASDRMGLVVRNGRVLGFRSGVHLSASYPYGDSGLHLVEEIEAEGNTLHGLYVAGRNSTVRRSTVLFTGGAPVEGGDGEGGGSEDTCGIALVGPGARALHNDVRNTFGNGPGVGRGLLFDTANGAVALGNFMSQPGSATGLLIRSSEDVIVLRNRFVSLSEGLVFDSSSTGAYRGNFSTGVSLPYQGGSDAGGNE
jgi:YD repeat-containing protein